MALIRRRGKRWQAVIRRNGWLKQSRAFATRADAEAWARELESEMDRGVFVRRDLAESTTLRELLERYAAEVVPGTRGGSPRPCVAPCSQRRNSQPASWQPCAAGISAANAADGNVLLSESVALDLQRLAGLLQTGLTYTH
jgi:hypothetical protein